MSVVRTRAVALTGLRGAVVEVEADLTAQQPDLKLIGLADKALGEATRRVRNACENSALPLPYRRLTVNLSPAGLPKQGTSFDLAIALAALATDGTVPAESIDRWVHLGELGLDGRVRPVRGVLPAVRAAVAAGHRRVVVPWGNRAEAELVAGAEVHPAVSLAEIAAWHGAEITPADLDPVAAEQSAREIEAERLDLADIVGQSVAVDALVVAAAGGHHLLMSGPPGVGKTMLARRLPGILPPLDDEAALEVAALRSLTGHCVSRLDRVPPWESPHHSASIAALVGGGSKDARPGAIARASRGVLFIDEASEASRSALDALRQPLESGRIEIHRSGFQVSYPARFQLVLATNPCPCGQFGVRGGACTCAPQVIRRYAHRLSGPLLDRIDLEVHLERVEQVSGGTGPVSTAAAHARVLQARERADRRFAGAPWRLNAEVPGPWLRRSAFAPDVDARASLDAALRRGALTMRGYDRVLRVALTLADLAGRDRPSAEDVGRALFLKRGVMA